MTYSTLVIGGTTVTFRADQRYSVTWGLFKAVTIAYPNGFGVVAWGGHSLTEIDVSGNLITNVGGDGSADKQIFDTLLPLMRDTQRTTVPATLTLQFGSGYVTIVGWVRNFMIDRDAPDGEEIVLISFNMLAQTFPVYTGS